MPQVISVGHKLRALRKGLHISIEDAAKRGGISAETWRRIEMHDRWVTEWYLRKDKWKRIANAVYATIGDLFITG